MKDLSVIKKRLMRKAKLFNESGELRHLAEVLVAVKDIKECMGVTDEQLKEEFHLQVELTELPFADEDDLPDLDDLTEKDLNLL